MSPSLQSHHWVPCRPPRLLTHRCFPFSAAHPRRLSVSRLCLSVCGSLPAFPAVCPTNPCGAVTLPTLTTLLRDPGPVLAWPDAERPYFPLILISSQTPRIYILHKHLWSVTSHTEAHKAWARSLMTLTHAGTRKARNHATHCPEGETEPPLRARTPPWMCRGSLPLCRGNRYPTRLH